MTAICGFLVYQSINPLLANDQYVSSMYFYPIHGRLMDKLILQKLNQLRAIGAGRIKVAPVIDALNEQFMT